jgi:hypothetical protein
MYKKQIKKYISKPKMVNNKKIKKGEALLDRGTAWLCKSVRKSIQNNGI